jgi:MoxR-like ATPase
MNTDTVNTSRPDTQKVKEIQQTINQIRDQIERVIVGKRGVINRLLTALLAEGHVLIEDVPGIGKTKLARSISAALGGSFHRIQFTPDLLPSDVTGSLVYDQSRSAFQFHEGPVFSNVVLADEINRAGPRTQSALLEAMEERQVSVDGTPRPLPEPFVVAATQNPVEYEGTYPLPEAQLDRFLLKLTVTLPDRDDEITILRRHSEGFDPRDLAAAGVHKVATPEDLEAGRTAIRSIRLSPEVLGYVEDICQATRVSPSVQLGVSPRGATALMNTARAWAWLSGRDFVTPDDVKALAGPTLRHRMALRPEAEMEGVGADSVLESILATVPVPR